MVKDCITEIDEVRTRNKFERFDACKEAEKPVLLKDPTVWAYAYLRDKQGLPLRLRSYQDLVVNDRSRFVLFVAANQIGKTWALCVKGVHHAIHVLNSTVIIGSKSEQQAIRVLDEIKQMLNRSNVDFREIYDEVANRTELSFKQPGGNVGKLVCVPATERALGYDATLILLDEFAFWENDDYLYEKVFETRTLETRKWKVDGFTMGQMCIISNPNGTRGKFYSLWKSDDRFSKYRFNWMISPGNTKEEYEVLKRNKDSQTFDMCYAAVFSSDSGGLITLAQYDLAVEGYKPIMPRDNLYLGLDVAGEDVVGKRTDANVLFGGFVQKIGDVDTLMVPYVRKFPPRTPKKDIYSEIRRLQVSYNVVGIAYDKPGVGDSIKNDLIDEKLFSEYQIDSLTYSLPNKTDVYVNLQRLYETGRIKHVDIAELKEQILNLRMVRTAGGHLDKSTNERKATFKIHHQSESQHDDFPDALANLAWKALRSRSPDPTFEFIEKKVEKGGKWKFAVCPKCHDTHRVYDFKLHYEKPVLCGKCVE